MRELESRYDKDSRIRLDKIHFCLKMLSTAGTFAGSQYIKHLDGDIWELRPLRDRVLFAAWFKDRFVILHHFTKKTQKTPPREIETAKRRLVEMYGRRYIYDRGDEEDG